MTGERSGDSYYYGRPESDYVKEELERLEMERADAMYEYVEAVRGLSVEIYGDVEPWAWQRLRDRRKKIGKRIKALGYKSQSP